jgi:hypothetical protein
MTCGLTPVHAHQRGGVLLGLDSKARIGVQCDLRARILLLGSTPLALSSTIRRAVGDDPAAIAEIRRQLEAGIDQSGGCQDDRS